MSKFTTPVSMQVTQEQYEKDLKEPLKKLGYNELVVALCETFPILVNNLFGNEGELGITSEAKLNYNRHFIDHYNPQLFLAIAAMTDEKDGISGEYWVCTSDDPDFIKGGLYKAEKPINSYSAFIDKHGRNNGWYPNNHKKVRKATKEELINHFTKENVFSTKQNKIETMFKKGDYIVTLKVSTNFSHCGKNNYCFKQREDSGIIHPEIDLGGSKNNGNSFMSFDKQGYLNDWRYATKEEISEYDRLGKPFDVTTLKGKDNGKDTSLPIIGYKLIKPEYLEAVEKITRLNEGILKGIFEGWGWHFGNPCHVQKELKDLGLIDIWCEPVFKQQEQIFKVGNFEVKVKDKKAFHCGDDITKFVEGLINHFKPQSFDKYVMAVEDVTFSKTGCQTTSKLSEWLEVFKALNK